MNERDPISELGRYYDDLLASDVPRTLLAIRPAIRKGRLWKEALSLGASVALGAAISGAVLAVALHAPAVSGRALEPDLEMRLKSAGLSARDLGLLPPGPAAHKPSEGAAS